VPDSNKSIVESSEKFLSEGVPDQGSAGGGLEFLVFGGISLLGFNLEISNRFLAITSKVPNSNSIFSGSRDPL